MSRGTVKVTPKGGNPGSLQISTADTNPYGVKAGDNSSFPNPEFPVTVGQSVTCAITSATTCTVSR